MTASARVCARGNIGIHIGAGTYVAFDAVIFSRDGARGLYADTWIGRRCFIGARSIVLPGVRIGDECVVGAGSVVTKDAPARSVVAGNPAQIIKTISSWTSSALFA